MKHIVRGTAAWPSRLDHLATSPSELWIDGALPNLPAVMIAVVGSRKATVTGIAIAHQIARDLARAGLVVISGMARGIDAAAHRGCLAADGITVGVLGCGVDVPYPRDHEDLRANIPQRGALLSEFPPGTLPDTWHFPKRNRLIAALASAVVVVEGTERSGALSTARWAADLGRDILAVPGSIRSPQSRGTNLLIRDGARPYLDVRDVLETLGLPSAGLGEGTNSGEAAAEPHQRELLERLGPDPVHPDDLALALHVDAATVAILLSELEMGGLVATDAAGLVSRAA